jgi:hypothetical protein
VVNRVPFFPQPADRLQGKPSTKFWKSLEWRFVINLDHAGRPYLLLSFGDILLIFCVHGRQFDVHHSQPASITAAGHGFPVETSRKSKSASNRMPVAAPFTKITQWQ